MPRRILHQHEARRDLVAIWNYFDEVGAPASGERLLRDIAEKLAVLSEVPEAGPARPELRPSLRSFSVGNYIIHYDHTDMELRLVRVIHGARDITSDLFEP